MTHPLDNGPPLLTDVIEAGLNQLERSNTLGERNLQIEILRAQLPELVEKAFLRIKPQLIAELEQIIQSALKN